MNKSPATAATETLTRHKKISRLAAGKLLAPHSVCLQAFHQIFPHYGHRLVGGKSAPSEWKNAGSGFCPDVLKLKIPAIDMLFVFVFFTVAILSFHPFLFCCFVCSTLQRMEGSTCWRTDCQTSTPREFYLTGSSREFSISRSLIFFLF